MQIGKPDGSERSVGENQEIPLRGAAARRRGGEGVMYQLLVVDDEEYAREGIMKTIDWDSVGITNVYGAECAEDAKEIVLNHMPEVIICDIEMTEESGIDFLRWLHYGAFSFRLIFLTAHANFTYAQDAVRLGAFEYFLKPVEHEVLKEGVRRALEDYERQMALHDRLSEYEAILRDWEMSGGRMGIRTEEGMSADQTFGMGPGAGGIIGGGPGGAAGAPGWHAAGEVGFGGRPGWNAAGEVGFGGRPGWNAAGEGDPDDGNIPEEGMEQESGSISEPELIGAVKQYISGHLGELTRESIADAVAVNASYLSRVFHKTTGEKLSAYILRKRIDYAKELLRETDDKITYIANAAGYLNDSYFIRIFRNVTEMTPYEYRKMCRGTKQGR